MNKTLINILLFSFLILSCTEEKIKYKGIERTIFLLNSSTEKKPNNVEIFFYGQSIIGGMKTDILIDSLKAKFPTVNLTFKHKPIGGFTVPRLIKTISHDLYHENPDLIIFHAYGGIKDGLFDSLIRDIRKKMTSDILLFDHHYVWNKPEEKLQGINKSHDYDSKEIAKIAKKYNCEFVNLREQWKEFLLENDLKPNELMGNKVDPNVHPNKEGNELLRSIILKKLTKNSSKDYETTKDSLRESIGIDKNGDFFQKEFTGNRLELELSSIKKEGFLKVLVNGKKPSEIIGSYYISRPSKGHKSWMPALINVSFGKRFPKQEKWTVTIFDIDRELNTFKFSVMGDKTGFDGQGNSSENFISDSEIIVIKKEDFMIFEIEKITKKECPNNFKIKFDVNQIIKDTIKVSKEKKKYMLFREAKSSKNNVELRKIEGDFDFYKLNSFKPFLNN